MTKSPWAPPPPEQTTICLPDESKTELTELGGSMVVVTHPQSEHAIRLEYDDAIAVLARELAGCSGHVYLDLKNGEVWLCDGSDLILWSGTVSVAERARE